jgi:hypothetical protein
MVVGERMPFQAAVYSPTLEIHREFGKPNKEEQK